MDNNKQHRKSKIGVIVIGILTALYSIAYIVLAFALYNDAKEPLLFLYGLIPLAILIGIFIVVVMRLKEISQGEIDEARKY